MEHNTIQTDDELVKMYANGNNAAFDTLLERYKSKLYTYIYYAVKDEDVADDLFQETFVKVLVRIQSHKYTPCGRFHAWLMRIAHNLIIDHFRQKELDECISKDDLCAEMFSNKSELSEPCRETQMENSQTFEEIKMLCSMLPESQSQVLYMRYYYNMSFKEIADDLNISINTALGRMRYALMNMRRLAMDKNVSLVLN